MPSSSPHQRRSRNVASSLRHLLRLPLWLLCGTHLLFLWKGKRYGEDSGLDVNITFHLETAIASSILCQFINATYVAPYRFSFDNLNRVIRRIYRTFILLCKHKLFIDCFHVFGIKSPSILLLKASHRHSCYICNASKLLADIVCVVIE